MTNSHQGILTDTELLTAARLCDESRFARILGLGENIGDFTINTDEHSIARDEPDFLLGVTYMGNSLLHLAASSNFLDLAEKIWRREKSLLVARNKALETPLHCAAKNGNHKMVSLFIDFASQMRVEDCLPRVVEVLCARNKDGETALHEAARNNHADVAHLLITTHPGLASVMDDQGMSPFYLATISGHLDVVHEMVQCSNAMDVSKAYYAGPDGQTALHAAVLRSKEMTEKLLTWKPILAQMPDNSGSTPLHFAASYGYDKIAHVLLECDHSHAYLHDSGGSFPVHVAAKMGHVGVIEEIMKRCPDSDELLDANGRNFLHVAAKEVQRPVLKWICGIPSTHKSMKNARDNEGNTPLHLAMDSGHEMVVKLLMRDKEVSLNMFNKKGLTLRDKSAIATFNDNAIYPHIQKVNFWIERSTEMLGAHYGARRWDQFVDEHTTKEDAEKENEKLSKAMQTIGLGSVLIATATFAAAFTMPGGYRADDHPQAGSPTLADKYAFKAFLVSDALAFFFAFHSTMILLFRGVTSSKPHLKKYFVSFALQYIIWASRCTAISFALAIYVVLGPSNILLGILVVIVGCVVMQYDGVARDVRLARTVIYRRQAWKKLDVSGSTPIHYAASSGDVTIIKSILDRAPLAVYIQDQEGSSPLHVAARMRHYSAISCLIDHCPDSFEIRDNHGQNFLHIVAQHGGRDMNLNRQDLKNIISIINLVSHKPDMKRLVNERDNDGNTPLHFASMNGFSEVILHFLKASKADTTVMNNEGKTALDHAVSLRSFFLMAGAVATLADYGATFSPRRHDKVLKDWKDETTKWIDRVSKNLIIVSVLIATIAFSAAFNVPGSFNGDGLANLRQKKQYNIFLVLDTIAMSTSVCAAMLLVVAKAVSKRGSWTCFCLSLNFLWTSLFTMQLAFIMAVYVALGDGQNCAWMGSIYASY
ncbi:ankyrin repeat-containing protein [Carex littledalei]|uniref:Ankyrin repeat-containing protein n=1 Tax=Carex littledalei TaxID=544730 RepID=A0A833VRP9_9POAL|nr:ankyrin repeat-containing protein [Carex littledalei]